MPGVEQEILSELTGKPTQLPPRRHEIVFMGTAGGKGMAQPPANTGRKPALVRMRATVSR